LGGKVQRDFWALDGLMILQNFIVASVSFSGARREEFVECFGGKRSADGMEGRRTETGQDRTGQDRMRTG
jgi:hypothetical protein